MTRLQYQHFNSEMIVLRGNTLFGSEMIGQDIAEDAILLDERAENASFCVATVVILSSTFSTDLPMPFTESNDVSENSKQVFVRYNMRSIH